MNFFSILESAAWQGISGIIAILAIIVTLIVYKLQTPKKAFSYEILSDGGLLNKQNEFSGDIKIFFKDKHVSYLRFVSLNFKNSGKIPIQRSDFDGSLLIKFNEPSEIFMAMPARAEPAGLPLEVNERDGSIEVKPLLLNSGDNFSVNFIINNPKAKIQILARIYGIKEISRIGVSDGEKRRPKIMEEIGKFATIAALVAAASGSFDAIMRLLSANYVK